MTPSRALLASFTLLSCAFCERTTPFAGVALVLVACALVSREPLALDPRPRLARTRIASELVFRHPTAARTPTGGWTKAGGWAAQLSLPRDDGGAALSGQGRLGSARAQYAGMTQGRGTTRPVCPARFPRFIDCSPSRNKALVATTRLQFPCFEQITTKRTNLLHPMLPRRADLPFSSLGARSQSFFPSPLV